MNLLPVTGTVRATMQAVFSQLSSRTALRFAIPLISILTISNFDLYERALSFGQGALSFFDITKNSIFSLTIRNICGRIQ